MTVSSTTSKVSYTGNGLTTAFAVPFYFLEAADLQVILRSGTTETVQALTTNYTVTGAGVSSGGTVTMLTAPAAAVTVTIRRNIEATQETDLLPNDRLPAESLETALDKATMLAQQLGEESARSIKFPASDAVMSSQVPAASARASKFLSFDSNGLPVATVGVDATTDIFTQSGSGAVPRSVNSKLREYLSPEDFGAVGDNATDDSVAMTAAMNAAVSLGLRLRLRDGATYFLSSWATFTNTGALRIESSSAGVATLRGPTTPTVFLSPAANFNIQGVTFSTWLCVVNRLVAQTGSLTNVVFSGNRCIGCTSIVFNFERPIENYRIEENLFENCTGGFAIRIGTNTFSIQDTWVKGFICRNICRSLSSTAGAAGAAFALVYGREVVIADNIIDGVQDNSGSGEAYGIYTKVRYASITGNLISNVNSSGSSSIVGINIKGTTRSVTSSPQGFAVICSGNHVRSVGTVGVKGAGIRGQTDDFLIFGNMVEDCSGGIFSDEASSYRNGRIQNNIIQFSTLTAGTIALQVEGQGNGVVVESNIVYRATTGIYVTTATGDLNDVQVRGNLFDGGTFNIIFNAFAAQTLRRLVVENNVVVNPAGTSYGALNNGGAGTVTAARFRFNDLASATAPFSGSPGTSPVVEGNLGYLSASGTWDPPDILNGASAATTLTVGGAAVGDAVVASFSNALGGLALAAQVSATDTVEVRLLNNSGGAVNLTSGTVRVRVTKGIA